MEDNLVIKLNRCRYLCMVRNKLFCGLEPLSQNIWEKGPKGVMKFNLTIFESIPELDENKCYGCGTYVEAEKFILREIKDKKWNNDRRLRLV